MLRVLIFVAVLAVSIYAITDCVQSAASAVRTLPKMMWLIVIALLPLVGAAAWFGIGRPPRPARGPGRGTARGPDDDPDFLRNL